MSNFDYYNTRVQHPYISPLYAPHGDFTSLRDKCSLHTLKIINDIYTLSETCLNRPSNLHTTAPSPEHHQLSTRLLTHPHPAPSHAHDHIHESIRLAAQIHTHALLHLTRTNTPPTNTTTPLVLPLLTALAQTDTSNSWGALRGVFLWACLLGGAASWAAYAPGEQVPSRVAWARKCFSLWALRAVVQAGFAQARPTMEMLRVGVGVGRLLRGEGG